MKGDVEQVDRLVLYIKTEIESYMDRFGGSYADCMVACVHILRDQSVTCEKELVMKDDQAKIFRNGLVQTVADELGVRR